MPRMGYNTKDGNLRMNLKLRTFAWLVAVGFTTVGYSQFSLSPEDTPGLSGKGAAEVGGKVAFDLISLKEGKFSFPLRFGHVVKGSETVDLDGRPLSAGKEYVLDAESGVISLKVPVANGQSLRVQYRYDDKKAVAGTYGMSFAGGASNFRFKFAEGGQFVLGMGQTERLSDGTLINSNIYGLANTMSFGSGGSLEGVMMVGERETTNATDLMGLDSGKKTEIELGQGTAIVQTLKTNALGGNVQVDYQDIDDRFSGFSAMKEGGMNADRVNQLARERGLKRNGFSFNNLSLGDMKFSQGYNWVGDSTGGITWRQYAISALGVSANWSSQYVDTGFNQFDKLREEDRKQLQKERGLDRTNFALSSKFGSGTMKYDNLSVQGRSDGEGVYRQNFAIDSKGLKLTYLDQKVDSGFQRFNDLREGDRGQLAKEQGMNRRAFGIATALGGLNVSSSYSSFGEEMSDLTSRDYALGWGKWNFAYASRTVDEDFSRFGSLTNEDRQDLVGGSLSLLNPALKPHGNDFNGIGNQAGLARDGWRLGFNGSQSFNGALNHSSIENANGESVSLDQIDLTVGSIKLNLKNQTSSDEFREMNRLYWNEQNVLGRVDGLNKLDFDFVTKLGSGLNLSYNRMSADSPKGGAQRQLMSLAGKNFALNYARRNVDAEFTNIGGMVDKERDLMASLLGFDQSQVNGFWQVLPNLRLAFDESQAVNSWQDQDLMARSTQLQYSLSKQTQLNLARVERSFSDAGVRTVDQQYDMISVNQNLGRIGQITVTQETHQFDGQSDNLPDAKKHTVAYETKLNSKTDFKTEQSLTKFEDGNRETSSSNTVATKLNDRVGVSVTDTRIRRDGDAPDETYRNYGLWVDFGKGIKLNYGYNRSMQGLDAGQLKTSTTLSGGNVGGVQLDGATYQENRVDGKRDQHIGNVSFANVNPFAFGQLKDIKFYYRTDTNRDYFRWQKETLGMGLGFAIGDVGLNFDYASQISQNGFRAIDRVVTLKTDKTDKDRLRGTFKYGSRTLPNDDHVLIRDYALTFDVNKFMSIQNAVVTNPAQTKNDVLLGSIPLDERRNTWGVKYQNDPRLAFDLSWSEIKRDNTNESLKREARMNMTLLANSPSPFQLSYALQQWDRRSSRSLAHTFGLTFNQRPGKNQAFSLSMEHLNWVDGRPDNSNLRDWQFRLDYSLRF